MESTFTKNPAPVGNSETSWKDSLDYESEYSKKWTGDDNLKLPHRSSNVHWDHVPDYHDADFDISSAEGMPFGDSWRPEPHSDAVFRATFLFTRFSLVCLASTLATTASLADHYNLYHSPLESS